MFFVFGRLQKCKVSWRQIFVGFNFALAFISCLLLFTSSEIMRSFSDVDDEVKISSAIAFLIFSMTIVGICMTEVKHPKLWGLQIYLVILSILMIAQIFTFVEFLIDENRKIVEYTTAEGKRLTQGFFLIKYSDRSDKSDEVVMKSIDNGDLLLIGLMSAMIVVQVSLKLS